MKSIFILLHAAVWSMAANTGSDANTYGLVFSTRFGGSAGEGIRDVECDADGNIYVAGTTRSADFPTTDGAFDQAVDISQGKSRWGYNSDIFVAKFSPTGELIWSTVVGGPNSEEAYGLESDSRGFVVVHGRGAVGSPVTAGVYQQQFKGCGGNDPGNPHNTAQNAYICKLTPDGTKIVWGSFFGIDHLHRDLALDTNDNIYVTWGVRPDANDKAHWDKWMNPKWIANAFQPRPQGGADCGVAKISGDGKQVFWATYLGGSDYDSIEASVDVDKEGYVYVGCQTRSKDIPTTPGAHDREHNGGVDWYVAKLRPDGSDLVYGTFIGDEGDNWLNTHNLVVDDQGNCYSSTCAFTSSFPTTAGAIQRKYGGVKVDWGIVKLSPTGAMLAGTLLGGGGNDNPDGIRLSSQGELCLFGQTSSRSFPVSRDAYQPRKGQSDDAVIVKLSADLRHIIYATYLGADGNNAGRAGCVDSAGSLIVAGASSGAWPLKKALQKEQKGPGDSIVAKLRSEGTERSKQQQLAREILRNKSLRDVLNKAKAIIRSGFNAGEGYGEVWIRDFATFIELSCQVGNRDKVRDNLLMFFRFQGEDGNIIDGFIPTTKANVNYQYIKKPGIPGFLGHKNTVETDQESSLIQAVHTYVQTTGDRAFLDLTVDGQTVLQRMERALQFLVNHRFSKKHGLLWGATTADWGDVQPEHEWGVVLDENSHRAIDIYDNAMFLIAISNYLSFVDDEPSVTNHWRRVHRDTKKNVRTHLWDEDHQKFVPHVYLDGSPFPDDFDESRLTYHGGTAVAIQAGLLSREEIAASLAKMVENVRLAGAPSIGLTIYPPYPEGFFKNPSMKPYSYQNGGDWTWFGGRMIQTLIEHGFIEEAYRQMVPMVARVQENDGFYEWYSVDNEPRGSGTFRGSAGVLGKAIQMLLAWAESR